jgi:small subunit ribosomal protein S6
LVKHISKHNYELMFILNPELGEEETENLLNRVKGYLEQADAQVTSFKSWGLRRMAYTIKGAKEGHYHFVHFAMPPENVTGFRRSLVLAEGILRELVIRVEDGAPAETPALDDKVASVPVFDDDAGNDEDEDDDEE